MEREPEFDFDILLEHITNAKQYVHTIAKQFLENKINFDCDFSDDTKDALKTNMTECISFDNQIKLYQQVDTKLEYEAHEHSQNSSADQNIDDIMNAADFDKKFDTILAELESSEEYDPKNDQSYKNLDNLLTDQSERAGNEDIEMLETDFVIPIDPISKQEITIPVRNKKCGHLYDKEHFQNIFKTHSSIKCPFTGCANKNVSVADVEEDSLMKIKIDRAKLYTE